MMHFKRRPWFVFSLVVSQLGCMLFGVVWASRWLRGEFDQIIHRTASAQAKSVAFDLARRITERPTEGLTPDSSGRKRLERLSSRIETPYNGFAAVLSSQTGELLAHSKLKATPTLLDQFTGATSLQTASGSQTSLLESVATAQQQQQPLLEGRVKIAGSLYQATTLSLPAIDAIVVVGMPEANIHYAVAELVRPLTQVGFILTAAVVGATALCTIFLVQRFDSTLTEVSSSVEREVDRRTVSLQRSRNAVVFGLAKLAESRDQDASQHLERVRTYVTILASELAKHNSSIDHHFVANLAIASSLHDVGKMGVPDAVILKLGQLTPAERRAMQMHTVLGDECLAAASRMAGEQDLFLELGRQVAAAHHEQWDGSGYPRGLQGKQIPLAARIVALADVYDALTSHRVYRPAVSHPEAREWIVSNYGSQFDPEVVEAFVAREADFSKISQTAVRLAADRAAADNGGQSEELSGEALEAAATA